MGGTEPLPLLEPSPRGTPLPMGHLPARAGGGGVFHSRAEGVSPWGGRRASPSSRPEQAELPGSPPPGPVEAAMILGSVFERFINESPLSVMSRATLEHALSASALDALFEDTAERGYTRELLFSTTVDVMSLVVCGMAPHVQSAYKHLRERIPVTLKCVDEKLQHIETEVSAELVRHVAGRCQGLITELAGACQPLLAGYRVKILDGNHLAATQRRLKVSRGHRAGPRPGQSLAVLDPASMLVTDVIPCEDAHAQERALIGQVLPLVRKGDVWIEDRNFCTTDFLPGVARRGAYFVIRRHGNLTAEPHGAFGPEFETDTGWVSERRV